MPATTGINIAVGLAQVLLPSLAMYGIGAGWWNPTDVQGIAAIFGTIFSAIYSGGTTVTMQSPVAAPVQSSTALPK